MVRHHLAAVPAFCSSTARRILPPRGQSLDTLSFRSIEQPTRYCGMCGVDKSSADKVAGTAILKEPGQHTRTMLVEAVRPDRDRQRQSEAAARSRRPEMLKRIARSALSD